MPVMVESPKSAMQARRSLLTRMFAFNRKWLGCKCEGISSGRKETYSFQISVDHVEVMHILQPICNTGQLSGMSGRLLQDQVTTYELAAVHVLILLNELVDVSVFHPLGYQSKSVFVQRNSEQGQDIWMSEMFPSNPLSAEPL